MRNVKIILAATTLAFSLSAPAFAGTITGSRTSSVGTITGSRAGTITGSSAGTITGSSAGTITGSRAGTITGSATGTITGSRFSPSYNINEPLTTKLMMLLLYL